MDRFYRLSFQADDIVYYNVTWFETDIYVGTDTVMKEVCEECIIKTRAELDAYINKRAVFKTSLEPIDIEDDAPEIVKKMAEASRIVSVGPMASVAGAFNDVLYNKLCALSKNIVLENGGDLLIAGEKSRIIRIYGGENKLKDRLQIEADPKGGMLAVCTSSGTLGHSLSFGKADSVTIISKNSYLADAAATAIANKVKTSEDISRCIEIAAQIDGIDAIVITVNDKLGAWGDVKFV